MKNCQSVTRMLLVFADAIHKGHGDWIANAVDEDGNEYCVDCCELIEGEHKFQFSIISCGEPKVGPAMSQFVGMKEKLRRIKNALDEYVDEGCYCEECFENLKDEILAPLGS